MRESLATTLRAGFCPNPRLGPLVDGEVLVDGVSFDWQFALPNELHKRYLEHDDLDVFELSIDLLLTSRVDEGRAHLRWTALPLFLTRTSRALQFLVNDAAGITAPGDLRGRRFAVPLYQMSATIWLRAMLRRYFGVDHTEITWVVAPPPAPDGTIPWLREQRLPPEVELRYGEDGTQLLARGEVDAAYFPIVPDEVLDLPSVHPLLTATDCDALWARLRCETGAMPINHLVALQTASVESTPDIVPRITDGFERSKRAANARQGDDLGADPFPSGIEANRASLELFVDELVVEGLLETHVAPADFLVDADIT